MFSFNRAFKNYMFKIKLNLLIVVRNNKHLKFLFLLISCAYYLNSVFWEVVLSIRKFLSVAIIS